MSKSPQPYTPPPLYVCLQYGILYLFIEGGGATRGESEPERRLDGQQFTKLGRKYPHDRLYLQSISSDEHLPPHMR
jgi:hypothetical protein